jgi:hypothetical protein
VSVRRALVAMLSALALLSSGCIARRVAVSPAATATRPPCLRVRTSPSPEASPEKLPPKLAEEAQQVEQVRGLRFNRPLAAAAVSKAEIGRLLLAGMDESFPEDEARRTGLAWSTIGVIPKGTDLRKALQDFNGSEVIGFYDNETGQLVFIGSSSPTPFQRFTLAHEMTHALQDQNFGLSAIDQFDRTCHDERLEAFLSLAEGDATETSFQWAMQNLSAGEIAQLQAEANAFPAPPSSVPPFLQNLLTFPYPNGQAFVESLQASGGEAAVDRAFRSPPVSTEQILHPSKYPSDRPVEVDVPNFAPRLGPAWKDLEFEDVGEGWFRLMLELRMPATNADAAAAGWSGAQYRAWTDGKAGQTAVVMDTTWDTERDASEFAQAMDNWLGDNPGTVLPASGQAVRVLFASDQETLTRLTAAVSG